MRSVSLNQFLSIAPNDPFLYFETQFAKLELPVPTIITGVSKYKDSHPFIKMARICLSAFNEVKSMIPPHDLYRSEPLDAHIQTLLASSEELKDSDVDQMLTSLATYMKTNTNNSLYEKFKDEIIKQLSEHQKNAFYKAIGILSSSNHCGQNEDYGKANYQSINPNIFIMSLQVALLDLKDRPKLEFDVSLAIAAKKDSWLRACSNHLSVEANKIYEFIHEGLQSSEKAKRVESNSSTQAQLFSTNNRIISNHYQEQLKLIKRLISNDCIPFIVSTFNKLQQPGEASKSHDAKASSTMSYSTHSTKNLTPQDLRHIQKLINDLAHYSSRGNADGSEFLLSSLLNSLFQTSVDMFCPRIIKNYQEKPKAFAVWIAMTMQTVFNKQKGTIRTYEHKVIQDFTNRLGRENAIEKYYSGMEILSQKLQLSDIPDVTHPLYPHLIMLSLAHSAFNDQQKLKLEEICESMQLDDSFAKALALIYEAFTC